MTFWDTVAGYRLAEVLTNTLPKIADGFNNNRRKQKQHLQQMPASELYDYLETEFAEGRRLVQAMLVPTRSEDEYVVVTE